MRTRLAVSALILAIIAALPSVSGAPAHAADNAWDAPVTISPALVGARGLNIVADGTNFVAIWISGAGNSQQVLASRSDDGSIWATPVPISQTGELGFATQLESRLGQVTAGWLLHDGSHMRAQIATTLDSGATWSSVSTISPAGADASGLSIASDVARRVATWSRFDGSHTRIQASVSLGTLGSWSSPVTVSGAGLNASFPVAVATGGFGGPITVAWEAIDVGPFVQVSTSYDDAVTWTAPQEIGTSGGASAQLVSDENDTTVLYLLPEGPVVASTSPDAGQSWSTPVRVSPSGLPAGSTSVALGGGRITAAWTVEDGPHNRVQVSTSSDGGLTWGNPIALSAAGQNAFETDLVSDGDTITATWSRSDGTHSRVQTSRSIDGGTVWSTPTTLSVAGQSALEPQVATDGRTTTVIWRRSDGAHLRAQVSAFTARPIVSRLAGADRYATAVAIAQEFDSGVPVVYLATGTNYPDALSAASAAAFQGGPLLLTLPSTLPPVVRTELQRLNPPLVVIVGGTGVVSAAVESRVKTLLPGATVRRDSGVDRYATSRTIADRAFGSFGPPTAFLATGTNFPDALSASAAAGFRSSPVVLVNGAAGTVDQPTRNLLVNDLEVSNVIIAGGTGVVSAGIQSSLTTIFGASSVLRVSGIDRYATGVAINADSFTTARTVYLATGLGYADALAGAALAGRDGSPLYVVPTSCVPASVLAEIDRLNARRVVLLGGTGVLTNSVANLVRC